MPFLKSKQIEERNILTQAISAVTRIEPRRWADFVHSTVVQYQETGCKPPVILKRLQTDLYHHRLEVCSGGNNSDGWKNQKVGLSTGQIKLIMSWINVMLSSGGRFTTFE